MPSGGDANSVRAVFDRVRLAPRERWDQSLEDERRAGVDPAVIAEVRRLLGFVGDEPTGTPDELTGPLREQRERVERLAAGATPRRIGRYTIVRVLGEGGMGTVYEAQQESPKRAVALKVIRAGYLSAQMLRRFEHESAVLGRLQHPGIAQVYEAGVFKARADDEPASRRASSPSSASAASPSVTAPLGHFATPPLLSSPIPFFAMEFIRGVPLTAYAAAGNLGTRERLELLAKVCDAV